jgi:EAL domain-containing protein (putative c-di-GMP-specific phosphodiesterase class I)
MCIRDRSTFISQRDEVIGVLNQIRQLGVQVAIDDFGTGYSSLSFLHNLPINSLKIDGSFVQNLEHSNHDRIIVQTILNLAHALNLQVTAEGVENQAQLEFLQAHGCDRLQGYLFTPPLPLAQFHEYCRSQPT